MKPDPLATTLELVAALLYGAIPDDEALALTEPWVDPDPSTHQETPQ